MIQTPPPPLVQISLGQMLAILAGLTSFIAIVTGAFRLGGLAQRVDNNEKTVVQTLTQFTERFAAFERFIGETSTAQQQLAGWRSEVDARLGQLSNVQAELAAHETRISLLEHDIPRRP